MTGINYSRARTVFEKMLARYVARQHPFQNLEDDLPQTMVLDQVKSDPLRLALHLFFACKYMRGTVISSHAFRVLNAHQEDNPWLFQPELVAFASVRDVQAVLGAKIPWQQAQVAELWRDNARVLNDEWKGDPRKIFRGASTKEDLYRRVMGPKYKEYESRPDGKRVRLGNPYQGFGGFQEKMTSMLAYFLEAMELIKPTALSAPVDFHHLRVYLATRMIEIDTDTVRYERVKMLGIELAERLQKDFGLTQVQYGDIVWLWSIRSCRWSPHNASTATKDQNGKEVRTAVSVTWTAGQIASHDKTCGRCQIADYCDFGIPPGRYYTTGVFDRIVRTVPPQSRLFRPSELEIMDEPADVTRDGFLDRFGGRVSVAKKLPHQFASIESRPISPFLFSDW